MSEFKVTAPDEGFSGQVAEVSFSKGVATVDSSDSRAALAYFRRRGYKVEKVEQADEPQRAEEGQDEPLAKPKQADPKEAWVAYIAATTDLSEAEAADLKKDDLIALATGGDDGA